MIVFTLFDVFASVCIGVAEYYCIQALSIFGRGWEGVTSPEGQTGVTNYPWWTRWACRLWLNSVEIRAIFVCRGEGSLSNWDFDIGKGRYVLRHSCAPAACFLPCIYIYIHIKFNLWSYITLSGREVVFVTWLWPAVAPYIHTVAALSWFAGLWTMPCISP